MLSNADGEIGTAPFRSLTVTVHVHVVDGVWYGSPSPGTSGPLTVTSADHFGVTTFTASPSEVSAGRLAVPTSRASVRVLSVLLGKNVG